MRTEELIATLAREAQPVEVLAPVWRRFGTFALTAAALVAVAVLVAGPRPDVVAQLADPWFLMATGAIVLLTLSAAATALVSSVPDAERSPFLRGVPLGALAGWAIVLAGALGTGGSLLTRLANEPVHASCFYQLVIVGSVPAVMLWREVRRAAPLDPRWTAVFVAMAAFGAGALSAAVTCPLDRAAHQVWWHFAPVVALAVAAAATPPSLFSRLSR